MILSPAVFIILINAEIVYQQTCMCKCPCYCHSTTNERQNSRQRTHLSLRSARINSDFMTDDSEQTNPMIHGTFCLICGCITIILCVWPIILLTPFAFGFGVLFEIDFGLETEWPLQVFCRHWSAFMSIKVTIGLIMVLLCEALCPHRNSETEFGVLNFFS